MTTYQEWKIKQIRMVQEVWAAEEARKRSALAFKAAQQAESDPPVTPDCAKADTP